MSKNDFDDNSLNNGDILEENSTIHNDGENVEKIQTPEVILDGNEYNHPTTSDEKSGDGQWICNICGYDANDKENPYRSLRGHFMGKARHDSTHSLEDFDALFPPDVYNEKYPLKRKQRLRETIKSRKKESTITSSAVKVKPVEGSFDPAEEAEILKLRKETEILKERLSQKVITDKLGYGEEAEREEEQFRWQRDEREDLISIKDKEISRLQEERMKDRERAHEKEILSIKNQHKIDMKFLEMENNFDRKLANRDAQIGTRDEEFVKIRNKFFDVLTTSMEHNIKVMGNTPIMNNPEDNPVIPKQDGDVGILSSLDKDLIVEE